MDLKKTLTKNIDKKPKKERIQEIDFLRGTAILLVILYHFCWSFSELLYSFSNFNEVIIKYPNLYNFLKFLWSDVLISSSTIHIFVVPCVGGLFIFVSGISTCLSKNNYKRELLLLSAALLISLATLVVTKIMGFDIFISFGVIHLMAVSLLFYIIINFIYKLIFRKETPFYVTLFISVIIFFISLVLFSGYNPITNQFTTQWTVTYLYNDPFERSFSTYLLEALGKYAGTTDWWPILPYTGVFFLGISIGKFLYSEKKETKCKFLRCKVFQPFCFIGRKTLIIYLIHQPIFITILVVVFLCLGFRF